MTIKFYLKHENPYGCFSNFFMGRPIELDGMRWPTVEHYFQAQKFPNNPEIREDIRQAEKPYDTKTIAKAHSRLGDWSWWDTVRDDVMLRALRA